MEESIFVPFIFFTFLAAVIIVPIALTHRGRIAKLDLIRHAIDKGQPIDPAALEALYASDRNPARADQARRSLGSGVILTMLALGLGIVGVLSGDFDPGEGSLGAAVGAAVIVGFLGVGFLILAAFDYGAKRAERASAQGGDAPAAP